MTDGRARGQKRIFPPPLSEASTSMSKTAGVCREYFICKRKSGTQEKIKKRPLLKLSFSGGTFKMGEELKGKMAEVEFSKAGLGG